MAWSTTDPRSQIIRFAYPTDLCRDTHLIWALEGGLDRSDCPVPFGAGILEKELEFIKNKATVHLCFKNYLARS